MLSLDTTSKKFKTRLLVQKGVEYISLHVNQIVLVYTQNRLVYAVDKDGRKYMLNKKLNQLEQEIDSKYFFRANRQCLINIQYIRAFRSYERVKLYVHMSLENKVPVIISQENAAAFKKWIVNAD